MRSTYCTAFEYIKKLDAMSLSDDINLTFLMWLRAEGRDDKTKMFNRHKGDRATFPIAHLIFFCHLFLGQGRAFVKNL